MDTNRFKPVTTLRIAGIFLVLLLGVFCLAQDIGLTGPSGLEISVCGDGEFTITVTNSDTEITNLEVYAAVVESGSSTTPTDEFSLVYETGTPDPAPSSYTLTPASVTWSNLTLAADDTWTGTLKVSPHCDAFSNRELVVMVSYDYEDGGETVHVDEDPVYSGSLRVLMPNLVVELSPEVVYNVAPGETASWEVYVSNTGDGILSNATLTAELPAGGGLENLTFTPDGGTETPVTGPVQLPDLVAGEAATLLGVFSADLSVGTKGVSCENLYVTFTASFGCEGADCQDDVIVTGSVNLEYRTPNLDYSFDPDPITTVPYCGSAEVTVTVTNEGATAGNIVGLEMAVDAIGMAFTAGSDNSDEIDVILDETTNTFSLVDADDHSQPAVLGPDASIEFTFSVSRADCAVETCKSLIFIPHFYDDCGDEFEPPIKELQIATYPPVQSDYDLTITPDAGNPDIPDEGATLGYTITATYNAQSGETPVTSDIVVTYPGTFVIAAGTDTGYTATGASEITWEDEVFSPTGWTVTKRLVLTAGYDGADCTDDFTLHFAVEPTSGMCDSECMPAGATANIALLSDTMLVITKSVAGGDDGIVYAGDPLDFTINVYYYGPRLLIGGSLVTPPAVVTDTLPDGMRYVSGSGSPVPNSTADNTLTWCLSEGTLSQTGPVIFTYSMEQIPEGETGYNECLCGTEITNTATVTLNTTGASPCIVTNPSPFSCNASASLTLGYDCQDGTTGFRATKTAEPSSAERCDYENGITFTNTITFIGEVTDWSDINFTDNGNAIGMVFADPGVSATPLTGTAHFTLNGGTTIDYPITLGTPLNLGSVGLPLPGTPGATDALVITYTLYFSDDSNTTGTTVINWSDLESANYNPDCGDGEFHFGAWVTPENPAPTVTISEFCHYDADDRCTFVVNRCDSATFRLYLTSTRVEYNVRVVVDLEDNYTFDEDITPSFVNITRPDGTAVAGFAPDLTSIPGSAVWDLGDLGEMGSDSYILFNLLTACSGGTETTATVSSSGRCGDYTYSNSETYEASRGVREGKLLIKKTPDVIYIKDRGTDLPWTIYVTNPGSGPLTNVVVTDTLGAGISYVDDSVTLSIAGEVVDPSDYTVVVNPTSYVTDIETTVTLTIDELDPGTTATITITGHVESCENRTNRVQATWGCYDETTGFDYCGIASVGPVTVQDLGTRVIINSHLADDINTCGGTSYVTVKFKNIGKAYAYDMVLTETLPTGVEYDTTAPTGWTAVDAYGNDVSSGVVFVDGSSHSTGGGTLTWTFPATTEMKPVDNTGQGDEFTIRFPVKIVGCSYASGAQMMANLTYATPCSTSESPAQDTVSTVSAPVLTVSKSPDVTAGDPSEPIIWNIEITNPSYYTAESVLLWDVPPTIFSSVVIAGLSGSGTELDPWEIGNVGPHESVAYSAMGMLKDCSGGTGSNTAWVEWCEDCKTSASSNISAVNSTPNVSLDVTLDVDYCGGTVTITLDNNGSRAYNVVLEETFPTGFAYTAGSTEITSSEGRTFSETAEEPTVGTGTLTWDSTNLGNIEKFETLQITFNLENEKGSGEACTASFGTSNHVSISYKDYCGDSYTAQADDTVSVPAVPNLGVTKELDPASVVIGETDPAVWHVTITNSGGAADGTITIVDTFGTGWNVSESTVTAPATINGTGTRTIVGNAGGGGTVTWSGVSLDAGGTESFDISVVPNNTGPEADLTNSIAVTGSCIGGCTYGSAAATSTLVPGHTEITKEYDKTEATIGETVHVTIRADYYGSSTDYSAVTISDVPEAGLIVGTPTATPYGACTSVTKRSGELIWDVADFTGTGWVIIEYDAVVANTTAVGTDTGEDSVLSNTVTTEYTTGTGTYTDSASDSLDVLEARLVVEKNDNITPPAYAREAIHYTITVHHPSSSVTNDTTAYDIVVTDTVPVGLEMPAVGDLDLSVGSATISGRTITWTISSLSTTDASATMEYDTVVEDGVEPAQDLSNTAHLTWTSLSGSVSGERTGSGTAPNDYVGEATNTLAVETSGAITKTRTSSGTATIGSTVTYRITETLPRATIDTVTITETIGNAAITANGIRFISATFTAPGSSTPGTIAPDSTVITGTNDGTGQVIVTWTFYNFPGYLATTANRNLVINITCDVPNVTENQENDYIPNRASTTYTYNGVSNTLSTGNVYVRVREPILAVSKAHAVVSPGIVEAGAYIDYTLTVTNSGLVPAYDVVVTDTVPAEFTDITSISDGGTASGNVITWNLTSIAASGSETLTYRVTVDETADLVAGETLTNSVHVTWTSLSGSVTGERTGEGTAPNDYYTDTTDSVTVSTAATITKTRTSPATATIGELVTYDINVTLPKATISPTVTVTETIGGGSDTTNGLRFLSATFEAPGGGSITPDGASVSSPNDGTDQVTVTWTFNDFPGYLATNTDRDLIIHVTCDVTNVVENAAGDVIPNSAAVAFTGATGTLSTPQVTVTLVEASLDIVKGYTVVSSSGLVEAGAVLEYTLTVTNGGTSTAYDVEVTDTLPEGLINPTDISDGGSAAGNVITWTIDEIPNTGTNYVTLTYRVTVASTDDVSVCATLDNTAVVTWTSVSGTPTSPSEERTGEGTPPNIYTDDDTLQVPVDTNSSIEKELVPATEGYWTIGSEVDYLINVTLPKAEIPSLRIEDVIGATGNANNGLMFVSAEFVAPGGGSISPTNESISSPNDGTAPVTVTWDFANIHGYLATDDDRDLVIVVHAVVTNVDENNEYDVIPNTVTAIDSGSCLTWSGGNSDSSADVTIREAHVTIGKTYAVVGGGVVEGGASIEYTLTLTNTDTICTAYDIVVEDTLGTGLTGPTYVSGDVTGNITHDFSGYPTSPLLWHINSLAPGASVTLVYDVTVQNSVTPCSILENEAVVTWTSTNGTPGLPAEERTGSETPTCNDYRADYTLQVPVDTVASITKELQLPADGYWTIGSDVYYQIRVMLPRTTISDLTVTDVLGSGGPTDYGLEYVGATFVAPGGGSLPTTPGESVSTPNDGTAPVTVTWTFSNIPGYNADSSGSGRYLWIVVHAVVANVAQNNEYDVIPNRVTATDSGSCLTWPGGDSASSADVTIREAHVTIDKTYAVVGGGAVEAGAVIRYTLTLTNTDTICTAYDIDVEDTLGTGLTNPTNLSGGDSRSAPGDIPVTFHINSLAPGASVTLVYDVTVDSGFSVTECSVLENEAVMVWTSINGTPSLPAEERTGSGAPTYNDYTNSDTQQVPVDTTASITKTLTSDPTVTIGSTTTYDIHVTLPRVGISNLTVTDTIGVAGDTNNGLEYVGATFTAPGGGSLPTTPGESVSTPNDGTAPVTVTWTFTNIPGYNATSGDRDLVIHVTTRLSDVTENKDGDVIPNSVTATDSGSCLTWSGGNSAGSEDVTVRVPALTITKTVSSIVGADGETRATVEPGGVVTYEITVANVGSGEATDVTISDTIITPEFTNATYISGGDSHDFSGNPVTWHINSIPGNTSVTVSFSVTATSAITEGGVYINCASVVGHDIIGNVIPADNTAHVPTDTYDTTTGTDRSCASVTGAVPSLSLVKEIVSVNGITYPGLTVIQPGDYIIYRVTVTNTGTGTAYDVDVTDDLDDGLTYGSYTAPSGGEPPVLGSGTYTDASWSDYYDAGGTPVGTLTGHTHGADPTPPTVGPFTWDGSGIRSLSLPSSSPNANVTGIVLPGGQTYTIDYVIYVNGDITQDTIAENTARAVGKNGAGTSVPSNEMSTTLYTHEPFFVTDKTITQIDGDPTNTTVAVIGSIIDYSYTITNIGEGDAHDVNIYDTLPLGFVYVPGSANIGDPTIGTDTRELTWLVNADIATGATYTVTFQAEVTDATSGGTQTNVMWAEGLDLSDRPVTKDGSSITALDTDNDDMDDVPVEVDIPNVPIILKKEVTPHSVAAGAVVHYTVTFTNNRKISFYDVTITDTMPDGFSYLPGTTLINGAVSPDPTGDNPYVFAIGTVGPESVTTLDYYVLVSQAARHGANVNWAVLNGHDGAGKPISLKDRATVTVTDTSFTDFEWFPFLPRVIRPATTPEKPSVPKEERPRPECCLHVTAIPVGSHDFGDTVPGQPEIYYQTDIAMYAATELLVTEKRMMPWLEVQGFDPEPKYLMTGLYNRMITKLGEYAQYNLGNVVMESLLGIPLDYAPTVLDKARREGVSPERAGKELTESLAERAGLSEVPDIQPIFLEYFGSYPYLHDRIAEDKLAWEDGLMDKNIMPAALGFTMLREANQIETFLASTDPTERFFGLLLLTQAVEKTRSISTDLAKVAEFSPPVKYLPHFSRIEVEKGRGITWRTTDETSTLYDHASVLWGLSKLRSVALHSAEPDVRALVPEITDRMNEVYRAIEAIHYDEQSNGFVSIHAPGESVTKKSVAAKDLAFTVLALRSVLFDNRDLSINTVDPERKIVEIADFMIEKLMGDDGGIYTAYNYADSTPVVGVKRTLVDNALAVRALLSAYVVTEDRKYRDAALDVYAFMVKELWYEDLMIFIDEEDPDYEVVLTPQSIGALIGALRELVLYGDPAMRHDYLDRMSYTTDRVLDQSQLQLYENRFFPWHAPITIIPKDPNGRSYIKPIITTLRDKGISHDLAPILVRKMVLNITPAGAIASGNEPVISDWNKWKANLRYEVPDIIASAVIDDTFVTDEGMYFTTLTRDYQRNLNADLPAFNPYHTDPGIQVYGAFVGGEVSRFNVENLTLNSRMGIGLSDSELVRRLAKKAGKSPEKYLAEYVEKRAPKDAEKDSVLGRYINRIKAAVGLATGERFADIIYLEYTSSKPFYTDGISDGWDDTTFDEKLMVSSMASTMVRQLMVILDNNGRNDLSASERFVNDVITMSVAAKRVALDEIIRTAKKGGIDGVPHSFVMVPDKKEDRDVVEIRDKKSTLFDDTFAIWAVSLYIDAKKRGLFNGYRAVMSDVTDDQATLAGLIDALIAHHYSAEYGTLVTGSVNTVEVSKALDMLTRAAEVMDDGPAKEKLLGLITKQADFIMNRLATNEGFAPMVGLGSETIPSDLCEMETLGTNVFPILALVRTSEVTGDEKYLKKALVFFDRFDETKWDQAIGLYLSSGTVYRVSDRSRLELNYNNQELIAAVLLVSKLQPHLSGERKILSAYHMTTFMNRIMEIASVERYPGNEESDKTIFSPEIIRSVKIILDESKGTGKPGDVFTNRIVVDNDCYDLISRGLSRVRIEMTLPEGFHYVPGSTRFNGAPGPDPIGRKTLNWYYPLLGGRNRLVIDYQVVADPNVKEGAYTGNLDVMGFSGYGGEYVICEDRNIATTTYIVKDPFAGDVEKECVPCSVGRRALSR